MRVGLRIDVDTFRGTRFGVPNLSRILAERSIKGTFFFSVGPDNMGRHLQRLSRPAFFWKMLRSRAPSLYGWDILLKGTLWPGPVIGEKLAGVIRSVADAGHEIGLHAWDHHDWQAHVDTMDRDTMQQALRQGVESLTRILGHPPVCSAVPGWKCNDLALRVKSEFAFKYNSDCRGESLFRPIVCGKELSQPQVPVTLPTYDELIQRNGITDENYNEALLALLRAEPINVLTIHAEVEGISRMELFQRFIEMAQLRGVIFTRLGSLLENAPPISTAAIAPKEVPGREGWIACQVQPERSDEALAHGENS